MMTVCHCMRSHIQKWPLLFPLLTYEDSMAQTGHYLPRWYLREPGFLPQPIHFTSMDCCFSPLSFSDIASFFVKVLKQEN